MHLMMRGPKVLLFCALVACGGSSSDGIDEDTAMLVIEPAASEHVILNGANPTQAYTATLVDKAGRTKDVTAETSFYVESSFGAFSGATLTIHGPGKTTISGLYTDKPGSAQVIARVKTVRTVDDPSNPNDDVPMNAPDLFGSGVMENPARAPTIVYPAENVVMPRNIGDFEAHWTDAQNNVFEVSLQSELADIRVYVAGNNGAGGGPRPSWFGFTPTEWLQATAGTNAVNYQVR